MYVHKCLWIADIRSELKPRLLLWAVMSALVLTAFGILIYGAIMASFLLDSRDKQHLARIEKMATIIQSAQTSLLLADESSTSNMQMYQGISASVGNVLNKLDVVYSFSLIDLRDLTRKYAKANLVPATDWEKYVAEQINSKNAYLVLLEVDGNLSVAQLINFRGEHFCGIVRLSGHSLSNALNLTNLQHRIFDTSYEKIPAINDKTLEAYVVPIEGSLYIVYWQPSLTAFSVTSDVAVSNLAFLAVTFAILTMLFGLFYSFLALWLQKYYIARLQQQDNHNSIISKERDESSVALAETRDEVAAYRKQKLAFNRVMAVFGVYLNHLHATISAEQTVSIEKPSTEEMSIEEIVVTVLDCFEVIRLKNKIHLKFSSKEDLASWPFDNWLSVVILYNLIHRAFCRANSGSNLEVIIGAKDSSRAIEVQDHGYALGPDHSSYFSDRTGMNNYLLEWNVLKKISEKQNMVLEHLKIDQETTRVILKLKTDTHSDPKEGPSNVIPLRR